MHADDSMPLGVFTSSAFYSVDPLRGRKHKWVLPGELSVFDGNSFECSESVQGFKALFAAVA